MHISIGRHELRNVEGTQCNHARYRYTLYACAMHISIGRHELRNVEGTLRHREQELRLLQDVNNQKLEILKQKSSDAHKVSERKNNCSFAQ
jgi:hypothetical protein